MDNLETLEWATMQTFMANFNLHMLILNAIWFLHIYYNFVWFISDDYPSKENKKIKEKEIFIFNIQSPY